MNIFEEDKDKTIWDLIESISTLEKEEQKTIELMNLQQQLMEVTKCKNSNTTESRM